MNEDRLRELEEQAKSQVERGNAENYDASMIMDDQEFLGLITAYRQLQKDIRQAEDVLVEAGKISKEQLEVIHRLLEGLRNIEIDAQGGITYGGMEEILIRIVKKSNQLRTELIKTYGE